MVCNTVHNACLNTLTMGTPFPSVSLWNDPRCSLLSWAISPPCTTGPLTRHLQPPLLVRLSPRRCPHLKHHWSCFQGHFCLHSVSTLSTLEISQTTCCIKRSDDIVSSGGFKGGGGSGGVPLLAHIYFKKPLFSVQKAYISLCTFAINEDGADKLSSAPPPFQNFWIRHRLWAHDLVMKSVSLVIGSALFLESFSFHLKRFYLLLKLLLLQLKILLHRLGSTLQLQTHTHTSLQRHTHTRTGRHKHKDRKRDKC